MIAHAFLTRFIANEILAIVFIERAARGNP